MSQGSNGDVGPLVLLQSPDEQQQPGVRQVELDLRLHLRHGSEHHAIDPRGNHADPFGVGLVQGDERAGLGGRGGEEDIRVAHHPLFALQAASGSVGWPGGDAAFFTFASVWKEVTRGTPQICFALLPTHPDSQ